MQRLTLADVNADPNAIANVGQEQADADKVAQEAIRWAHADPRRYAKRPVTDTACNMACGQTLRPSQWADAVTAAYAADLIQPMIDHATDTFGNAKARPISLGLFPFATYETGRKPKLKTAGLILFLWNLGLFDLDTMEPHRTGIVVQGCGLITPQDAAEIYAWRDRRDPDPNARRVIEIMQSVEERDDLDTPGHMAQQSTTDSRDTDSPSANFGHKHEARDTAEDDQDAIGQVTTDAEWAIQALDDMADPSRAALEIDKIVSTAARELSTLHRRGKARADTLDTELAHIRKTAEKMRARLAAHEKTLG